MSVKEREDETHEAMLTVLRAYTDLGRAKVGEVLCAHMVKANSAMAAARDAGLIPPGLLLEVEKADQDTELVKGQTGELTRAAERAVEKALAALEEAMEAMIAAAEKEGAERAGGTLDGLGRGSIYRQ